MIPAKERLKRVADRLSDDDAAIVLSLARSLLRRRVADEDADDARAMREALAEPGEIPLEDALARRGL